MCRILHRAVIVVCLACPASLITAQSAGSPVDEAPTFTSRILALTDVVLERHIDPPTRQQMILTGVKALYLADNRLPPKELSTRVSELSSRAQFTEYLDSVHAEFDELEDGEAVLTRGLLAALPGASFLIEAEANKVQESVLNNRYVGTGIALAMNADEPFAQITKVFADGPAWIAGVKTNDLILAIDGESAAGKALNQIVEELRGEDGSDVVVVVRQPDSSESRTLTMTRGRVFIPTVEGFREQPDGHWQYTVDSAPDIALLRITSIGPSTLHELRRIAAQLHRQDVRGVVLDLRNGGGILHYVVLVADSLLDGGTIGHVRSWDSSTTYEARPGDHFGGMPITVLVAKNSSPGHVFLAAALQDNLRAAVVGEPTSGDTFVASILPIPGRDDRLRLATAVMLRSDGTPLLPARFPTLPLETGSRPEDDQHRQRPGFIVPDHIVHSVAQPDQLREPGPPTPDPVLARAIEIVRNRAAEASPEVENRDKTKSRGDQ